MLQRWPRMRKGEMLLVTSILRQARMWKTFRCVIGVISHFNAHVQKTKPGFLPFSIRRPPQRQSCCDLAFGFQLHAARKLARVQNIPSALQSAWGWWGRLFSHSPLAVAINVGTKTQGYHPWPVYATGHDREELRPVLTTYFTTVVKFILIHRQLSICLRLSVHIPSGRHPPKFRVYSMFQYPTNAKWYA